MAYNVEKIREDFPSLQSGTAYFDGPGGSQTPSTVAEAIKAALLAPLSNRGVTTASEQNANEITLNYRTAVADLVGGEAGGVVYGRSWTQLVYDFSRTLAKSWGPGDEIVVSNLDHDSNVRPWIQAAESRGATVRWAKFDLETGELSVEAVASQLSSKTKFVSITGASNVLGTKPNLAGISEEVHNAGALFAIDGVHLTPHAPIDVQAIGADFFGFSSYKMLGPHCGAMIAKPELLESLRNDKLLPSTMDVPERFEFGTLPYEIMAGATAAIDYTASLDVEAIGTRREKILMSMKSLEAYEEDLFAYLLSEIAMVPGFKSFGHAADRTPTLFFQIGKKESTTIYKALAQERINAPASNFYALECSRVLGLGDLGAVRAGLAPYSTHEDVDRLVSALKKIAD